MTPNGATPPAGAGLALWVMRGAWAALVVAAGPALGDALADASRPVQAAASAGLWLGWAGVLGALLVPRATTLTILRLAAVAPLAAAAAAVARGPAGADDVVALTAGVVVAAVALLPAVADALVDGSSYGAERRFALRTPLGLALTAVPVAWGLAVAVPATAVVLLAARAWLLGGVAALIGVAGVAVGAPAMHKLSRRWLVLVPAGLVVHDRLVLADPVLLRRAAFASIGPAPADAVDAGALDLTGGALGLALELRLDAPAELGIVTGRGVRRVAGAVTASRVLVTPLRPGAVLREARARRYPVATAEPTTSSPS